VFLGNSDKLNAMPPLAGDLASGNDIEYLNINMI
jgi:hypothetical protein